MEQFRRVVKRLPTTTVETLVVATAVAASAAAVSVVQARYIGFPVPFRLVLGTPGAIAAFAVCVAVRWGKFMQHATRTASVHHAAT
jgi:hypothetical protein